MNDLRIQHIPELIRAVDDPGKYPGGYKRLGRHIHWDPRSKLFRVERKVTAPVTKFWLPTNTMALDQGDIGACTGFSTVQCLNSAPFNMHLTDVEAKDLYHLATVNDNYDGTWPPDDTGSDGLSAMKSAQSLKYITSYSHCFNLDDVIHGLQSGPGIAGINWFEGFDSPNVSTGIINPDGLIRGGHEITIQGCDLEECLIWFRTSWGAFGKTVQDCDGMFCMTFDTAQTILFADGDATFPIK